MPRYPIKIILLLGLLTLGSLLINLWGIKKNLPYNPEVDEGPYWIGRAVHMAATGSLNPKWFGHPGSTVLYPLAAAFRARYGDRAEAVFSGRPEQFYLAGRVLVALYGSLSIPLVYLVGRGISGPTVGLIGAWFLLWVPLFVYHCQVVRSDSAAVFFGLFALWRIIKVYENPRFRNQLWAGIGIGLSCSSRYFMVLLAGLLLAVDLVQARRSEGFARTRAFSAAAGLVVAGLAFALTSPYFFLDFNTTLENLKVEARNAHVGADGLSPPGNLWWYLTFALPLAVTWPLYVLVLTGSAMVLVKRSLPAGLLVGYAFFFLSAISFSALHWQRWIIPILPVFTLLAAIPLETFSRQVFSQTTRRRIFLWLGISAFSFWPAYQTVLHDIRESNPSTRILAREWIMRHLPQEGRIAQEWYTAPLNGSGFQVKEIFSLAVAENPETYRREGFAYLIVSDAIYQRFLSEPLRYPKEIAFYQTLFNRGRLLQEFAPSKTRGGPVIRIYQVAGAER